jgi:hypothetical protein
MMVEEGQRGQGRWVMQHFVDGDMASFLPKELARFRAQDNGWIRLRPVKIPVIAIIFLIS